MIPSRVGITAVRTLTLSPEIRVLCCGDYISRLHTVLYVSTKEEKYFYMQLWPQSKGGFFLKLYLGKYFGIIVSYKTVLLNSNHQNHTITQQPQTDVSHNTDILYMRSPSVVDSCINSDKEHCELSFHCEYSSSQNHMKAKLKWTNWN